LGHFLTKTFVISSFLQPKSSGNIFHHSFTITKSSISAVDTATGYGMMAKGSEFESWNGQQFSPLHTVQTTLGPLRLLSNGYRGFFPRGVKAKKMYLYIHSIIRLHCAVLNQLGTETNLPILPLH
jgi:hypothetical protein